MDAGADLNIPFSFPGGGGSNGSMKEMKKWSRPHDLITSTAVRKMLYARISATQTVIPLDRRDRCMHCALSFDGNGQDSDGDGDGEEDGGHRRGGECGDDADADADKENVNKSAKKKKATSLASMMASSFLSSFSSSSLSSSSFSSSGEKVSNKLRCSMCVRVVCETCASFRVTRPMMPVFLQEQFSTTKIFTVCTLCYAILKERNSNSSKNRSTASNHLSEKRRKAMMQVGNGLPQPSTPPETTTVPMLDPI